MSKSDTSHHDQKIANMTLASVWPHYITKIEKKGRTQNELFEVVEWLTGFDRNSILHFIDQKISFEEFFNLSTINSNAHLIRGVICGYRIEDISNKTTQRVRYLDKLVDELAKGRALDKIMRTP